MMIAKAPILGLCLLTMSVQLGFRTIGTGTALPASLRLAAPRRRFVPPPESCAA